MLGSKHGKLDQKTCLPNIPFKNITYFYKNTRKYIGKLFMFHFENLCLHWVYGKLNVSSY